jgi:predicted glycoside hydrolase/deacetylase ChbG (UPF0249 family)
MPSGRKLRKLIVNADDFGQSAGINQGIIQAHDRGIVTSASLMVHQPAAMEAVALARSRPRLSLGLHIDVGEWRHESGRWIPVYERAPQDDPSKLGACLIEQIELFSRLTGNEPTHLDSHQHVHTREPLQSMVCQLGDRLGVPVRHFNPRVFYCGDFYGQDAEGNSLAERVTACFLINLIQTLRDGVTELGCHPAADLDFQGAYYRERLWELDVLCSAVVVEALRRERVLLTSFAHQSTKRSTKTN